MPNLRLIRVLFHVLLGVLYLRFVVSFQLKIETCRIRQAMVDWLVKTVPSRSTLH